MKHTITILAALCFLTALMAPAQEVPLGEVARANRQKTANKQSEAKPGETSKPGETNSKRVFTNDDIATTPPPPAASSDAGAQSAPNQPPRRYKKGIPLADALRRDGNIRGIKSIVARFERDRRRLEEKPDKTPEDLAEMRGLSARIAEYKEQIAKLEAALYE